MKDFYSPILTCFNVCEEFSLQDSNFSRLLSSSRNLVKVGGSRFEGLSHRSTPVFALAGVAQWIECWPVNQRVASLIPSQGTCLGCGPGPQ